jgi:hypothetical protein
MLNLPNIIKKLKKTYPIIVLFLAFFACQSPKEKLLKEITKLENSDSAFNLNQISSLYANYALFANKYPDDEHTPSFLFKASQQSAALNKPNEGILFLEKIINEYPKSKLYESAIFALAFSYENNLSDFVNAKKYYELYLSKFPNSEMAEDAKLSIKNLGKSDEDYLKDIISDSLAVN